MLAFISFITPSVCHLSILDTPFFFLSSVNICVVIPFQSLNVNNWAVGEDSVISSKLPRTHSGQRNWWGCSLPVARLCPKYYTQCHELHVRPWKCSPCISAFNVPSAGGTVVMGTTDGGQAQRLQSGTPRPVVTVTPARQTCLRSSPDFHRRAAVQF